MSSQTESGSASQPLLGVVGFFDHPDALLEATRKVRDARYPEFDCFTPYPVHGLNEAQGISRSILPRLVFGAAVTGCLAAFGFQYWTSAVDWPLIVGGKPFNSWPAFVPVIFEVTILFSAITTVFGMFALNRLPNLKKKSLDPAITRDRFAILIEAKGAQFEVQSAQELLKKTGAQEVRTVYQEGWF